MMDVVIIAFKCMLVSFRGSWSTINWTLFYFKRCFYQCTYLAWRKVFFALINNAFLFPFTLDDCANKISRSVCGDKLSQCLSEQKLSQAHVDSMCSTSSAGSVAISSNSPGSDSVEPALGLQYPSSSHKISVPPPIPPHFASSRSKQTLDDVGTFVYLNNNAAHYFLICIRSYHWLWTEWMSIHLAILDNKYSYHIFIICTPKKGIKFNSLGYFLSLANIWWDSKNYEVSRYTVSVVLVKAINTKVIQ